MPSLVPRLIEQVGPVAGNPIDGFGIGLCDLGHATELTFRDFELPCGFGSGVALRLRGFGFALFDGRSERGFRGNGGPRRRRGVAGA